MIIQVCVHCYRTHTHTHAMWKQWDIAVTPGWGYLARHLKRARLLALRPPAIFWQGLRAPATILYVYGAVLTNQVQRAARSCWFDPAATPPPCTPRSCVCLCVRGGHVAHAEKLPVIFPPHRAQFYWPNRVENTTRENFSLLCYIQRKRFNEDTDERFFLFLSFILLIVNGIFIKKL